MDADTRKSLAEQLLANPLLEIELTEMEKRWTDTLVNSNTEEGRIINQAMVRAIRIFRADLVGTLSTRAPKSAPA
jgi:hypothetical protein